MGDRTTAEITIGGTLRRCCAPDLLSVLMDFDCWLDYTNPVEDEAELEDVLDDLTRRAAEHGGPVLAPCFGGHEINYGNLDEIKELCRERGLAYRHHWDAGGGYTAGNEYWAPGDAHPWESAADQDGDPMLSLSELRAAADRGRTLTQLLADYAFAEREIPPLELVDAPAGEACPACVAEALQPGSALPTDYPTPGETEAA
jgi:hypothetical protein